MFCRYCGRELKDGEVCDCRNVTVNDAQSEQEYNKFQLANGTELIVEKKHKALMEALRSPFLFVITIMYSISVAICDFNLFSALTVAALWIIFAMVRRKDGRVNVAGFKMLTGVNTAKIIISSISYGIFVIFFSIMLINADAIRGALYRMEKELGDKVQIPNFLTKEVALSMVIVVGAIVTVLFVLGIIYYVGLKNSYISMRQIVEKEPTYRQISGFSAIFLMLNGVFNIVSVYGNIIFNRVGTDATDMTGNLLKEFGINIPKLNFGIPHVVLSYLGGLTGICSILFGIYLFILRKKIADVYKD